MSDSDCTPERLLDFLREAPRQGVLNPAVARSRANAIEQLFPRLTRAEREDLRRLDVDRLAARVDRLQDSTLRPEVLALYTQRVREALKDFLAWREDPEHFVSCSRQTVRRGLDVPGRSSSAAEAEALENVALATSDHAPDMLAVPIRTGVTVYLTHLPLDLSHEEAERLCRVIRALAVDGAPRP